MISMVVGWTSLAKGLERTDTLPQSHKSKSKRKAQKKKVKSPNFWECLNSLRVLDPLTRSALT
jgi:hypothetical protein